MPGRRCCCCMFSAVMRTGSDAPDDLAMAASDRRTASNRYASLMANPIFLIVPHDTCAADKNPDGTSVSQRAQQQERFYRRYFTELRIHRLGISRNVSKLIPFSKVDRQLANSYHLKTGSTTASRTAQCVAGLFGSLNLSSTIKSRTYCFGD